MSIGSNNNCVIDNKQDPFLVASLEFLHGLLAQRILQCGKLNGFNSISKSRLDFHDFHKGGKNIAKQLLYSQGIDHRNMELYKRQLRSMEHFLSTIQYEQHEAKMPARNNVDCDAIGVNVTNDNQYQVFTKYFQYPNGSMKIPVNLKSTLHATSDFTKRQKTPSDNPVWTNFKNNGVRSSGSYADMLRNAVSGLTFRNCSGRKYKSNRNKHNSSKNWNPGAVETMKNSKEGIGLENKIVSENGSKSDIGGDESSGLDVQKEIPLRVKLAMETDDDSKKPVTLLVRVPSTVLSLLNRKIKDRNKKTSSNDRLPKTCAEQSVKKKKRIISSVFRNFLKGKRTATAVYSTKDKFPFSIDLGLEKMDNVKDNSNRKIYALKKSASCHSFACKKRDEIYSCKISNNESIIEEKNAESGSNEFMFIPSKKNVNGYETISLSISPREISYDDTCYKPWTRKADGIAWRKATNDKTLRTEMMGSSKGEILNNLINYNDEKIIPLRRSEASPQLGQNFHYITQCDLELFLNLAKEMQKNQVQYPDGNSQHVELPVEIKTMKTPLQLHKIHKVPRSVDDRVFRQETKYSYEAMSSGSRNTQRFLKMPIGTLPDQEYLSETEYSKSQELPSSSLDSIENESRGADFILFENSEDSALQVILRHIATDTSTTFSSIESYAAEKDTFLQTPPKRQLSKISVCYSSESLSAGSDNEILDFKVQNNTLAEMTAKNENSKSFATESERKLIPCGRTELVIIEEKLPCDTNKTYKKKSSQKIRDNEKTLYCRHSVLSKQIFRHRKELADAMIRWWGPRINYSTTPSSQTQLSTYSVSINNLM